MTPASVPAYETSTRPFTTSVTMAADGVWVTIVDFGLGATLTRLFDFDHHLVKPVDPDQLARLLGDGA